MSRTRAERRYNDWKKAIRKHNIRLNSWDHSDWYDNLHQYSKNKIHCSCPICRSKRKDRDRYGKYCSPFINKLRRIDEMNYELWKEIE